MFIVYALLAYVILLALVSTAVAVIIHTLLWYESFGTPHEERLRRLAREGLWRFFLGRIAISAACQFFLLLTLPLGRLPSLARPDKDASGPCVVFIHGLYNNPAVWLAWRRWFRQAGLPRQYCPRYESLRQDFMPAMRGVAAQVRAIMKENPDRPLILVGHSLGGVIARRLLAEEDIATRVAACVTVGAPHRGSSLGALGFGRLVDDLHPTSEVMLALQAFTPAVPTPALSLRSNVDAMVLPVDNSRPPAGSGFQDVETPTCGHVQFLYHPGVARMAIDFAQSALAGQNAPSR